MPRLTQHPIPASIHPMINPKTDSHIPQDWQHTHQNPIIMNMQQFISEVEEVLEDIKAHPRHYPKSYIKVNAQKRLQYLRKMQPKTYHRMKVTLNEQYILLGYLNRKAFKTSLMLSMKLFVLESSLFPRCEARACHPSIVELTAYYYCMGRLVSLKHGKV